MKIFDQKGNTVHTVTCNVLQRLDAAMVCRSSSRDNRVKMRVEAGDPTELFFFTVFLKII